MVDAGTIELIRSFGVEIVSSANLVQTFEAIIDEEGYHSHLRAGVKIQKIKDEAFTLIGKRLKSRQTMTEFEVQQYIVKRFNEEGLTDDDEHPIVGVNDHPADPHFEPTAANTYAIKPGDTLLIDLWAREKTDRAIYYDITWCGFIGQNPPAKYKEIFNTVVRARNTARDFIRKKYAANETCYGYEVDDVCRKVIAEAVTVNFSCIAPGTRSDIVSMATESISTISKPKTSVNWCPEFVSRSNREYICRAKWPCVPRLMYL
jgi:Xaa-Pro aminopeptidase